MFKATEDKVCLHYQPYLMKHDRSVWKGGGVGYVFKGATFLLNVLNEILPGKKCLLLKLQSRSTHSIYSLQWIPLERKLVLTPQ